MKNGKAVSDNSFDFLWIYEELCRTALISGNQLNTLACVIECLLTDKEADNEELLEKVERYTKKILTENDTSSLIPETAQRFYEEIRPIDAFCCANRVRGLAFRTDGGM